MTAARAPRALRVVVAALVSGIVGSLAGGVGARLAMWIVRLQNGSHDGEITHAGSEVGRWTMEGTIAILFTALSIGLFAGVPYLLLRRVLPGPAAVRGLVYGTIALGLTGGAVLEADYEYVRYVDPRQSLALFAALFPLAGVVVAVVADGIAPRTVPGARRLPWIRWVARAALALVALSGAADLWSELASVYRL